jgi:hypothetical protein
MPASHWWLGLFALGLLAPAIYVTGLAGDGSAPTSEADVDRRITVNVTAVECPESYDNRAGDDVCLAYDGRIPGPTFVFTEGERVQLELRHRVASTIADLNVSDDVADELAEARYTLHRHGVSVVACDDGVARPKGTNICGSTVRPGGSITYNFTAKFPGDWHYHDHALGLGVGTEHGEEAGPMAEQRGLWGSFLVVPEGEQAGSVLDLHLLSGGPNGGLGLEANVTAGERFDLIATGLGDASWTVTLADPAGETIWRQELGPGVSRGYTVPAAEPGNYTWTATSFLVGTYEGTVSAR